MGTTVVKLGSTLVADERGELREDVLRELCRQVAGACKEGDSITLVTSGAIARGMRLLARSRSQPCGHLFRRRSSTSAAGTQ